MILNFNVLSIGGGIDSFGIGFTRMFKLCKESGVNIGYGNSDYSFTFMFQRINNYLLEKRIKLDENVTLNVSKNVSENVSICLAKID